MKSRGLFLSAIIIAILGVSCDRAEDSDIPTPIVRGKVASISLQISGTPQTKASGNPSQEDKVLKLDAFVFNIDGSLEAAKSVTSQNNSITKVDNIAVTSGEKRIFVLANYASDISAIKSITELQNTLSDLKNEKDNGQLTMSTDVINAVIVPGKNYIGYTSNPTDGTSLEPHTFLLTRLTARVKVEDMQWQSSEYSFEGATAFILNAVKNSHISNSALSLPVSYYQGLSGTGDLYPSSSTVLSGSENFLSSTATNNNTYFYLYENQPADGTIYPTILVLRAKVKQNNKYISNIPGRVDSEGYTYFPVIINLEGNNSTVTGASDNHKYIRRNNTYNIKTIVKGLGTSNPFSSESPSSLNVQVSVAPWALNISQTSVFE